MRRRKDGKIVGESNFVRIKVGKPDKFEYVTLDGMVYGYLAIHKLYDPCDIWEKCTAYQVTHVPTGYALPGHWPKQSQARALVQALQDPSEELNWSFDSVSQMPSELKRRARQITTALQAKYGVEDD